MFVGEAISGADGSSNKRTFYTFLFSDMIIFAELPAADGSYQLVKYLLLSQCKVADQDLGFGMPKLYNLEYSYFTNR